MSVIKDPPPKSFEKLLSNSKYEIPDLQRDYDWESNELKKFWKDAFAIYKDDVVEYFVGPMVFVEKGLNEFQVIDGQQRLLTMSILASAVRDILIKINEESPQTEITNTIKGINQLLYSDVSLTGAVRNSKIKPSGINDRFYKDEILVPKKYTEKIGLVNPEDKSNQKILEAYKFFINKLNTQWNETERVQKLPDFIERTIKAFVVITIKVDSLEKGHRVFETLNYRGRDLSVSSLVKNHFLEKSRDSELRENISKWKKISDTLRNVKFDDFLKHYWIARYEIATPSNLFDKIKIEIDSTDKVKCILDELIKTSEIYKQLRKPEKNYWYDDIEIVNYLEELNNIFNDSAQPALLNAKIYWGDKSKIKELVRACSIIHFRAKTIGTKKPNEMVAKMGEIAKNIRENPEGYTIADCIKKLSELDTGEPNFVSNFKNYSYSGKLASYVLKKIESFRNGEFTITEITAKGNLEHILPQSLNDDWEKYFDEDSQKEYVSKIGNMTILHAKLNRIAQNYSFETKIKEYEKQPGIKITEELLEKKSWTKEVIENRTDGFAEDAKKIWKI